MHCNQARDELWLVVGGAPGKFAWKIDAIKLNTCEIEMADVNVRVCVLG